MKTPHDKKIDQAWRDGMRVFAVECRVVLYWLLPDDRPSDVIPARVQEYLAERSIDNPLAEILSVTPVPRHSN